MAGNGPWSVKGIDPKARAAAKQAAQRQGLTVGEWLSRKMLEAGQVTPSVVPAHEHPGQTGILGVIPRWDEHNAAGVAPLSVDIENLARRVEATEHRSTLAITGIDQSVLGLLAKLDGVEKLQTDVSEQLAQSLQTLDARLAHTDEETEQLSSKLSRELKDMARRVDTIGEQSDINNSKLRHELDKDVELINNRSDEISQRLAHAEKQTDNALRTLEASFLNVNERLKASEVALSQNSDSGLSAKFDQRFSLISNELIKVVAETRGQLAAQIEAQAANPKLAQMETALLRVRQKFAATENRHASTLEQIAVVVSKLGEAVESRLQTSEQRTETRLVDLQQDQAAALEKVGRSMTQVAERLEARFAQTDKAEADKAEDDKLEARLRLSETRTAELVEEALQRVHQRLDEASEQTTSDASPVQRALATLTDRLAAIESRTTPPFAELTGEPGEPATSLGATGPNHDVWGSSADVADVLVTPPNPLAEPLAAAQYPQAESAFEQPSLPPLDGYDAFDDAEPEGVLPQFIPSDYNQNIADAYPTHEMDPNEVIGATANQAFVDAARRSMLSASQAGNEQQSYPAGARAPASETKRKPRGVTSTMAIAVSVFAVFAVGVAATVAIFDFGGGATGPLTAQKQFNEPAPDDRLLNGFTPSTAPSEQMVFAANPEQPTALAVEPPAQVIAPTPKLIAPIERAQAPVFEPQPAVTVQRPAPVGRPIEVAHLNVNTVPDVSPNTSAPIPASSIPPVKSVRPSLEQAANAGDPVAQFQYAGSLVDTGREVEAAAVMRQAAEKGLPAAQYQLAKYYANGTGVTVDDREARRWTERSANGGNRRAMHNLAMFYAEGRSVAQSYESAAKWFEEAALLGLANSQYNLALLYEQGLGVPQSSPDAYAWYAIAARAGDRGASEKLVTLKGQLPPEAVTEAETITERFRPRPLDLAANGVFRNLNWGRPQVINPTSISRSQILLARLGYKPGPADGAVGAATRLAVIAYERDNGLAQTGRIDTALLSKLENSAAN